MSTSTSTPARARFSFLLLLTALFAAVMIAAPAAAQDEAVLTQVTAKTALYGLYYGHTAQVAVVESAPDAPASEVLLLLIDKSDRILARKVKTMRPGTPVQLRFDSASLPIVKRRTPVRVEARIVVPGNGSPDFPIRNAPILSVEFHNQATGDLTIGPTCPLPFSEEPAGRGPVLPSCGPCQVDAEPLPIRP